MVVGHIRLDPLPHPHPEQGAAPEEEQEGHELHKEQELPEERSGEETETARACVFVARERVCVPSV